MTKSTFAQPGVSLGLVRLYAAGGYIGRASGRAVDARRHHPYAPYDRLRFEVPVLKEGDVNARLWIRVREIAEGRKAGAADYIVKPFAPDHVLARASQILGLPG